MIEPIPIPGFTDPVSSMTHLFSTPFFLTFGIFLVYKGRGHKGRIFALILFVFASLFMLSMSGVYHLLSGTGRMVLQRLDHASIFFLIASTFTAIHVILFKGFARWGILAIVWILAITGITLKSIFFSDIPEWVGLIYYLGLGWIGLVSAILIYRSYGNQFIKPMINGAMLYTYGAVLDISGWPVILPGVIGPHEIFHLAVVLGLAYHWKFIFSFANGVPIERIQLATY